MGVILTPPPRTVQIGLRRKQTFWVNNSRIPRTKSAKLSEYYFHLNTNIDGDFRICISVPLNKSNTFTPNHVCLGSNREKLQLLLQMQLFGM